VVLGERDGVGWRGWLFPLKCLCSGWLVWVALLSNCLFSARHTHRCSSAWPPPPQPLVITLQTKSGLPIQELLVGNVHNWTIYQFLGHAYPIRNIRDHDVIWVYHAPVAPGVEETAAAPASEADSEAGAGVGTGAGAGVGAVAAGQGAAPVHNLEQDVVVCLTRREVSIVPGALSPALLHGVRFLVCTQQGRAPQACLVVGCGDACR
jgi:hypothetical protein